MCGHHLLHGAHSYPDDHRRAEAPTVYTPPAAATRPCPQCHAPLQEDFVFCQRCGAEVLTACPACHRAVRADWTHCAYCGADLLAETANASAHSQH